MNKSIRPILFGALFSLTAASVQAAFVPGPEWTEFAHFDGSTVVTPSTYTSGLNSATPASANWSLASSTFDYLGDNFTMVVAMGEVTDYFRVATPGDTLTDMLISNVNHLWSDSADGTYVQPLYYSQHLGGSLNGWPSDGRTYLSFWGTDTGASYQGGCCTTDYNGIATWGQAFSLYVADNADLDGGSVPNPGTCLLLLGGMAAIRIRSKRE